MGSKSISAKRGGKEEAERGGKECSGLGPEFLDPASALRVRMERQWLVSFPPGTRMVLTLVPPSPSSASGEWKEAVSSWLRS